MNHLPEIHIKVIPHKEQNYNTVGDYWKEDGVLEIRISRLNAVEELAILQHELSEIVDMDNRGVTIKQVDAFDYAHPELDEPGADKRAPYYISHKIATKIERLVIKLLGGNWKKYEDDMDKLWKSHQKYFSNKLK